MYSKSPYLPCFNSQQGPPMSSLSGSNQGRNPFICSPRTPFASVSTVSKGNPSLVSPESTKEGTLSYVLQESPFASVSTVSRGHPSLVSLEPTKEGTLSYVLQEPHLPQFNSQQGQPLSSLSGTNQGTLSYVLQESPFASVSTVSRGHPSLVSLNQPRKDPFHMFSKSPHLSQFQRLVSTGHAPL
jgi:hypothetical protein